MIDGRNVWRANLAKSGADSLKSLKAKLGERSLGGLILLIAAQPGGFDPRTGAGPPDPQLVRLRLAKMFRTGAAQRVSGWR
ncbi:hypothetical protein ACLK2C_20465 [Escherichia coli]